MNAFQFVAPTKLFPAFHAVEALTLILKEIQPKHVAIFIDCNVAALDRVQEVIQKCKTETTRVTAVEVEVREPDTDFVDEHAAPLKADLPDLVIGIGGGSTLDLSKAVSVVAFNQNRAAEYQGRNLMPNPGCPSVMIPTTAGTGSEVTPGAVVLNPETKRKGAISSPYITPNYAILDPELTMTMPQQVAWSTGIDALAHAIESFTARCATPITQMYCREAFQLISHSLPQILAGDKSQEIRSAQQLGATLAGVAICNSDTGACHAMAYPLGIYHSVPHGVAVGLLLPHVMSENIRKGARNYAVLADLLPGCSSGLSVEDKCWKLQNFVANLFPTDLKAISLKDFGIGPEHLSALADRGMDLKTALENNPVDFTRDDAQGVLEKSL
jgi:alcohol dehydrogenase